MNNLNLIPDFLFLLKLKYNHRTLFMMPFLNVREVVEERNYNDDIMEFTINYNFIEHKK